MYNRVAQKTIISVKNSKIRKIYSFLNFVHPPIQQFYVIFNGIFWRGVEYQIGSSWIYLYISWGDSRVKYKKYPLRKLIINEIEILFEVLKSPERSEVDFKTEKRISIEFIISFRGGYFWYSTSRRNMPLNIGLIPRVLCFI